MQPLPLLISGDHDGNIIIWDIKSRDNQYRCLMHVKNTTKDEKDVVATSCDYLWNTVSNEGD